MVVLDTAIANVSLRYIAGSLGASIDESTWVVTTYLIANAIVLPVSGWLSNVIGRKRFYMLCVATVHGELAAVRARAEPQRADRLSRPARAWRRRHADQRASHPGRHVSAAKARPGVRALRHRRHRRADGRADARRLDHRQLFLALDFFHQRADRHRLAGARALAGRRARGARARAPRAPRRRAARRLDRICADRAHASAVSKWCSTGARSTIGSSRA